MDLTGTLESTLISVTAELVEAIASLIAAAELMGVGIPVVLPVFQGSVYTATARQNHTVRIMRNDTPRIYFDFGADYTGWTPWFGAKVTTEDLEYVIEPREVDWSDIGLGQGYIDLEGVDTYLAGKFKAEIELRKGSDRLTAMKFNLRILPDVINE